ncbi:MAG: hypothetical protein U1E34_06950 [Amaricoccus sp.]
MQHDPKLAAHPRSEPLRAAMLDLVSRSEAAPTVAGLYSEECDLIAALQQIVQQGRQPADALFGSYHGDVRGQLARVFAEYGY